MLTLGGHMAAAAWKLGDIGRTVSHGICCGRALDERLVDPFAVPDESVPTLRLPGRQ
jgi:hypothetical protein